ncbi:RNA polymerase sigma-70 factor (ECF subfamily) [Clostridium tetanomorphum]|uniref:Sigma-70 family RNA polymerase sigma factor n=1 Tax=Clostridium tetanomorphum TaxID=1553 RepID=A0A923EBW2_CLOTT|nr:hypothetical protein [Clostridium tetanomorphum]KAJ53902.1 RNA polymerase ECF-type sigma factor [Clostridium tetanomorphum DSM 665]MBC2398114.1 hypothetical protein [Clostridium tetanomorphum]MBP1864683.1 RNA polymerase sigma-70 factor (ECF subfamily) [Clostridium tetanomorphum]NRS84153.1 RNA polymerase sigma-70 factor (ECF subfamily) [Clostridium tetanomorphum]NRZ97366.1 RNA polymerase sigma-70 factor (ECF subfamily) [Clostridium tetanomorphum]
MIEDRSIVESVLNGEYNKFEKLIEKYEKMIFLFIYTLIGDINCSQKLCKKVFTEIYNNLYRYNINLKLSNWILSIAVKEYYNLLKYSNKFLIEDNYINLLNIQDKCILVLRKIRNDLTFEDISEILNLRERKVKDRYINIVEGYKKEVKL